MISDIRAVLFDMGGVLVQLGSFHTMLGESPLSPDELSERWILSDAVQAFESGRSTVEEFAEALVVEMEMVGSAAQFIDRFAALPQGLFPGAAAAVGSVADDVVTGVLSNTSAFHWDHQIDAEIIQGLCQRSYLSYEVGLAKPHREIFDFAVADLGLGAEQVLFVDDNQVNVDGARGAGLRAELARGPEALSVVLSEYGVIR